MVSIVCEHLRDNTCHLADRLAGGHSTAATAESCAVCDQQSEPRALNSVTVSLAVSGLGRAGRKDEAAALLASHGHLLQRVAAAPSTSAQERLQAILAGHGVGSQLWKLLGSLGIEHKTTCTCLSLAERMNALGPSGCREKSAELLEQMRKNQEQYDWTTWLKAGTLAVVTGLAFRLNPLDPLPGLLDEAIRLAELAGAGVADDSTGASKTQPQPPQGIPKLILRCNLCPGDILTLTAAVESLHQTYPGQYLTDVRTPHREIWQHNPRLTPIADDDPAARIEMHYPSINRCNQEARPFLGAYTEYLAEQLGRPLGLKVNRPFVYLSAEERAWPWARIHPMLAWLDQPSGDGARPLWIIDAGVKPDYTTKQWPIEYYQDVVDRTRDRITWLQVGLRRKHLHTTLCNVIDLTDTGPPMREMIVLASRIAGGLGPITFFQHLLAAHQKPYVCLAGGREPATWIQYPYQHTLHTVGQLDCCRPNSCWKARVVKLSDGDKKDENLCRDPVTSLDHADELLARPVGRCMLQIKPHEVLHLLERLCP